MKPIARRIRMLLGCALLCNLGVITQAQAEQINWSEPALAPLIEFFMQGHISAQSWPNLTYAKPGDLPAPYDFLLTQPLMTLGIAKHYQRQPKLRKPLYVINNSHEKVYSRAIIMIVDNDKHRDDALLADKKAETTIVELGLITMNFAALPPKVIDGVLHTQTPLGALLADNAIKTQSQNRRFFKIHCNNALAPFLNCAKHPVLYGRTNTLIRSDNGQWLARVVEILTGAALPQTSSNV